MSSSKWTYVMVMVIPCLCILFMNLDRRRIVGRMNREKQRDRDRERDGARERESKREREIEGLRKRL